MYNLTEEEKQKIHTALICASDSGTLDEFTKEELSLINEAESIVNKLTLTDVVVPKGTFYCWDGAVGEQVCEKQCVDCKNENEGKLQQ
jgi:hypothetical protein